MTFQVEDSISETVSVPLPSARSLAAPSLALVRSRGEIDLAFQEHDGRTTIRTAFQSGCLRLRVPRTLPGDAPCATIMNTGGGIAGGDRLDQSIAWGENSIASVTTQAAEKVYRTPGDAARITSRLTVSRGARAEWLPQETILFDRAALDRDMQLRLHGDAEFLGLEAVVLGRKAMDETVRSGMLRDRWRIWRDGRLIYADALKLDGAIAERMGRAALGAGARAFAVLIHISARAAALLGGLREALTAAGGLAAASAWNGLLVARFLAPDGATLRRDMLAALAALREGRAMPRVWMC
ncbi:urease accessory protein UreD [Flavisphingomonas formosensis]|uniref:urease accessory protein UreD n=1 Tax=Flavisphingomonas formosensis TaxID=861534 RepID=UPI0012F9F39A|nr:urease accessory protein UreD [Sphingomonas formosensis]